MSETNNADAVRAEMSKALLSQMATFGDPLIRANAEEALNLQGGGPTPTPTAPAPNTKPVVGPTPTPQAAPTNDPWASERDVNGLIWGKFKNGEDAKRSYFHAQNSLSSTTDELVKLRTTPVLAEGRPLHRDDTGTFLPGSTPGAAPRVNPTTRGYDPAAEIAELVKESEESGQIDPLRLATAVASIASRTAEERVEARISPMEKMAEADYQMREKYPTAGNLAPEIKNFIKSNPDVGATVGTLLQAGQFFPAMEYAFTLYTIRTGVGVENAMLTNRDVAEEERGTARAAAGFASSPNTGVHAQAQAANEPITRERIEQLNEFSKVDRGVQRRREMLGHMLPPEMRTWEQNPQ